MKRNRLFMILSLAAILVLLLAACGDDDDADPTATSPSAGGPPTETRATGGGGTGGGGDELAAMGEEIYNAQGCVGCHSTDGSANVGPTWQGLWGSEVTLEDGSTVTADEDYITNSIRNPNDQVHEGFQPIMPAYPNLSDEDIAALIAFMQTLS